MARSQTGWWWNIARNLGYHLALQNFGDVGFNPEVGERFRPHRVCPESGSYPKEVPSYQPMGCDDPPSSVATLGLPPLKSPQP